MDIGTKIKALREEKGWSQAGLGRFAGLTQQTISLIERGEISPRLCCLGWISQALGVTIIELLQE